MTDDQFARLRRMVGEEGLDRLRRSRVCVAGLGAVGSYAVEALARAGVGHLKLIDFDVVRPSNLNRQIYALTSTLGRPKSELARERVLDINPLCRVEAVQLFLDADSIPAALADPRDLLIDAIDSVGPKTELISFALMNEMPLISSMGAALRTETGLVRVGKMEEVSHCPLARRIRKDLRRRGLRLDFPCVYSLEQLSHLPEDVVGADREAEEEVFHKGRVRNVLGSLPTLTGIFGLTVANQALRMLLGEYFPGKRARN